VKKGLVLVTGTFNVLHPGHLRLLKFARGSGERLVVGVLSDAVAGAAAHVPEDLRLEAVRMNGLVDDAFLVTGPVEDEIARLRPAVVVKGREHRDNANPEREALARYGGRLLFSSGDVVFSSLDLIRREIGDDAPRGIGMPEQFLSRRGIGLDRLAELVRCFKDLEVVVVGDTIMDEYVACDPLGMSEEDPTIVVTPISTERFVGGAAIVAAHAARLGGRVTYVSVVGDDEAGRHVAAELARLGVRARLVVDDSRPTTVKQRYRTQGKTLLRVSRLSQRSIDPAQQDEVVAAVEAALGRADLVIFSDFNYGVLAQGVVDRIGTAGRARTVTMAADSQSSSQLGDVSRYRDMTLLTPTEREARLALKNSDDGIVVLAQALAQRAGARNVILKMGADGALLHGWNEAYGDYDTDQVPALNSAPRDVAGAGDCLLVVASMALARGASLWEASLLGSLAAAVQVGRVGNTPIQAGELLRELRG
jgi:rfaE bifunctional protein kinase chain/domain